MQIIEGRTLENQTFVLEEVVFVNCVVRKCQLFYSGGDFEWKQSSFEDCTMHFRGAAKNTVAFLRAIGLLKWEQKPPGTIPKSDTVN